MIACLGGLGYIPMFVIAYAVLIGLGVKIQRDIERRGRGEGDQRPTGPPQS